MRAVSLRASCCGSAPCWASRGRPEPRPRGVLVTVRGAVAPRKRVVHLVFQQRVRGR